MFTPVMLFVNQQLEERFRKFVKTDKEVGGWFIVRSWEPIGLREKINEGKFRRRFIPEYSYPLYIETFIAIPNESKTPKGEFNIWDFRKAKKFVEFTAKTLDCWELHFHSHPNDNREPSKADLGFAASILGDGYSAMFSIVTPNPMRIWPYHYEFGALSNPDKGNLGLGSYISWRERGFREFIGC